MHLKVLQLNVFRGRYLDDAIRFINHESPDIITFEEVTTFKLNTYKIQELDLFEELKSRIHMNGVYDCVMKFNQFPDSCFGNAVFSKFKIKSSKVVILRGDKTFDFSFEENGDSLEDRPYVNRHLLDATLDIEGKSVHAIAGHGAWTAPPTDTDETLRQADLIVKHLESLGDEPFILGGDLNMPPGSEVINRISKVANNLMLDKDIPQTLNPKTHFLKDKGFLIDFIFISRHFKPKSLLVPMVDVSDHLPVVAELEF